MVNLGVFMGALGNTGDTSFPRYSPSASARRIPLVYAGGRRWLDRFLLKGWLGSSPSLSAPGALGRLARTVCVLPLLIAMALPVLACAWMYEMVHRNGYDVE